MSSINRFQNESMQPLAQSVKILVEINKTNSQIKFELPKINV